MKISIITVCYNSSKYLEQTILSVINQTYLNVEYIVIDGGSTDDTLNIVDKYKEGIAYFISEPDKNMYDAINKGLNVSTGDYIAILNSDDFYLKETTIEEIVNELRVLGGSYQGIYGDVCNFNEKSELIKRKRKIQVSYIELLASKKLSFVGHPNLIVSKEAYNKIGYYDCTRFSAAADYDYVLRLFSTFSFKHVDVDVIGFRVHNESITSSGRIERELRDVLEKNGVNNVSFIRMKFYFYKGWFKYLFANLSNVSVGSLLNIIKNRL